MEELNKKRAEFLKKITVSTSKEATIDALIEWCGVLEIEIASLNKTLDEIYK